MVALQQDRPWTYTDLLDLPEGTGKRHEIIAGELFVSASPTWMHQMCLDEVTYLLQTHVRLNKLGVVISGPIDIYFSQHTVLVPDVIFIRSDRLGILSKDRRSVTGAPDLIVEVASPTTERRDRLQKMAIYADAGVPEYWLPNPLTREFDLLVLVNGQYQAVEPVGGKLASRVLAGFLIDPEALFANVHAIARQADAARSDEG